MQQTESDEFDDEFVGAVVLANESADETPELDDEDDDDNLDDEDDVDEVLDDGDDWRDLVPRA